MAKRAADHHKKASKSIPTLRGTTGRLPSSTRPEATRKPRIMLKARGAMPLERRSMPTRRQGRTRKSTARNSRGGAIPPPAL